MSLISRFAKRRSLRGDAPVTCMLIIVGILALCIGGYYMFWYNRALERAEHGLDVVTVKKLDTTALSGYRLRVRDHLQPMVSQIVKDTRIACNPVLHDKVTDSEEALKEIDKAIEAQRNYIGEVNGQTCPVQYVEMHKDLAMAIGLAWKGTVKCRKAMSIDDARERKILLKSANEDLKKAKKCATMAEVLCKKMFDDIRVN